MGLDSLNQPAVLVTSGIAAQVALPLLESAIANGNLPFDSVRILNSLFYALNVFAVSRPGRLDGKEQDKMTKNESDEDVSNEAAVLATDREGRTLLAPSKWAFSIWGPIFLGELVFCVASFALDAANPLTAIVKRASSGFMISQLFQVLWAASFRPKYTGKAAYISSALLAGAALSLDRANRAYTSVRAFDLQSYSIYFLPLSLHFGWTTAASLVTLNGNFAMTKSLSPQFLAWAGHISVAVATGLAVAVTITRQAPVYGGVLSWALAAIATGMQNRVKETGTEYSKRAGVYGARIQRWLCAIGAVTAGLTSILVARDVYNKS